MEESISCIPFMVLLPCPSCLQFRIPSGTPTRLKPGKGKVQTSSCCQNEEEYWDLQSDKHCKAALCPPCLAKPCMSPEEMGSTGTLMRGASYTADKAIKAVLHAKESFRCVNYLSFVVV